MKLWNLFVQILNMSITASFVIAVILSVRIIIRKLPKKYSFLLWLIVGIRLVCPFAATSPFSMFNLNISGDRDEYISPSSTERQSGQKETAANIQKGQPKFQSTYQPVLSKQQKFAVKEPRQIQHIHQQKKKNKADASSESKLMSILAVIWLSGIAIILMWNLYIMLRIRKTLYKAVLFHDVSHPVKALHTEANNMFHHNNIYECDNIASPFVIGLINPKIYIPFRLLPKEQSYIIKHEQYHIHRKDNITKFLAFLITTVHWFNPIVWAAYLCMVRDMEMSCDEHVLLTMGKEIKRDYSQSLLAFAVNQRRFSIGMLAFGESDTRRRIRNIMNYKQKGKWMGILGIALFLAAGVVCLTDGSAADARQTDATGQSAKLPNAARISAMLIQKSLQSGSTPGQTEAVSKENFSDQTKTVDKDESANAANKNLNYEEIYDNFLSGKTEAIDKEGYNRNISYYCEGIQKYAFYDMNGDAVPELIVKSRISLDIFWINNHELALWHSDSAYARPLNNMALLYERAGGAPEHTDYMYTVLGYHGEELYKTAFSEYATEIQGVQYGNRYFIDDIEVTKETYDSQSEQFLKIGDDKIEWKLFP